MPVKKDASGRRSVEAEVEVPGTPEDVWQAIATGPGITSWFVPATVEEREGGSIVCNFGPGMESLSTITTWEPPHRFVADSRDDMGPDDPTVATEWIVEARSGGTCVVRVVHSWFTSSDDWDDQFEGHTYGWISFFRVLRLYLEHFRGQPGSPFQLMGVAPEPKSEAWEALTSRLGLKGAEVGKRVRPHRARHLSRESWNGRASPRGQKSCSSGSTSRLPVSPISFPTRWAVRSIYRSVSICTVIRRRPRSPAPSPCGRRG